MDGCWLRRSGRGGGGWRARQPNNRVINELVGLRAIKTQKQVSYGVPPSQREQSSPSVLLTVVKHMATLAEGLQISQPVIGGVVVKVRGRQHYSG